MLFPPRFFHLYCAYAFFRNFRPVMPVTLPEKVHATNCTLRPKKAYTLL